MGHQREEQRSIKNFVFSSVEFVCFWLYTGQLYHIRWKYVLIVLLSLFGDQVWFKEMCMGANLK